MECRIKGENQGILVKTKVKIQMEQGRGIVGGKSSAFTTPPLDIPPFITLAQSANNQIMRIRMLSSM